MQYKEIDISFFGKEIAPCLGITTLFAVADSVDNKETRHSDDMYSLLQQYDIKYVEIPRLKQNGEFVCASLVRELVKHKKWVEVKALVPHATYKYLKEKF